MSKDGLGHCFDQFDALHPDVRGWLLCHGSSSHVAPSHLRTFDWIHRRTDATSFHCHHPRVVDPASRPIYSTHEHTMPHPPVQSMVSSDHTSNGRLSNACQTTMPQLLCLTRDTSVGA